MSEPLTPGSHLACQPLEFMPLWENDVKPGLLKILQNPFEPLGLITKLYTAVYRLASNPCTKVPVLIRGSQNERVQTPDTTAQQCLVLYYLLRELLKEHLDKVKDGALKQAQTAPKYPAEFAYVYVEEWFKISESLRKLKAVFNYLQNHWHTLHMHNTNIFFNVMSMGYNMWNDQVLNANQSTFRLKLSSILSELYFDEDKMAFPPNLFPADDEPSTPTSPSSAKPLTTGKRLLKDANNCLVELDQHVSHSTYNNIFETPLKDEITKRCKAKELETTTDNDLHKTLKKIEEAVAVEVDRAVQSVQPVTIAQIRVAMLDELVVQRLKLFLDTAMDHWVVEDTPANVEALSLLHDLLRHSVRAMDELKNRFINRMVTHACDLLKQKVDGSNAKDPIDVIFADTLVRVSKTIKDISQRAFKDCEVMHGALAEGTKRLINNNTVADKLQVEQALARFLHHRIVHGEVTSAAPTATASASTAFDTTTEMILYLFEFIDKPETFHDQYHLDLSRRLIYLTTLDVELERGIISKFGKSREQVHRYDKMISELQESGGATSTKTFILVAFAHFWPWVGPKNHLFSAKPIASFPGKNLNISLGDKKKVLEWIPGISYATIQTNPSHFTRSPNSTRPIDVTVSHLQALILIKLSPTGTGLTPFSFFANQFARNESVQESKAEFPYTKNDVAEALLSLQSVGLIAFENQHKATLNELLSLQDHRFTLALTFDVAYNADKNKSGGAIDSIDVFRPQAMFPESERDLISQTLRSQSREGASHPSAAKSTPKAASGSSEGAIMGGVRAINDDSKKQLIQIQLIKIVKNAGEIYYDKLLDQVRANLIDRFEVATGDIKEVMEKLIEKDFLERGAQPNIIKHVA